MLLRCCREAKRAGTSLFLGTFTHSEKRQSKEERGCRPRFRASTEASHSGTRCNVFALLQCNARSAAHCPQVAVESSSSSAQWQQNKKKKGKELKNMKRDTSREKKKERKREQKEEKKWHAKTQHRKTTHRSHTTPAVWDCSSGDSLLAKKRDGESVMSRQREEI